MLSCKCLFFKIILYFERFVTYNNAEVKRTKYYYCISRTVFMNKITKIQIWSSLRLTIWHLSRISPMYHIRVVNFVLQLFSLISDTNRRGPDHIYRGASLLQQHSREVESLIFDTSGPERDCQWITVDVSLVRLEVNEYEDSRWQICYWKHIIIDQQPTF